MNVGFSLCSQDSGSETHRIAPSPVVHVRGLCESVVEADLVEALEKFGNICYVMMMPFKRQALVEFEEVQSADRCVACGSQEPVYIAGQQAYFNYSTSKRITRPTNADDPNSGNKVLLLSIQNPLYPITTDVLYTVCNPIGNVLRIVIFKRNGIQAMVEFESIQNAQKAKAALNGADIYAGCCTLKIEYARPSRLNVIRNDNDITVERGKGRQRQAILGEHPSSYSDNGYGHVSKQHAVIPSQVFELEDGSSSYKDFAMTRNNRFTSAGQASKNIIQPPSCVLHFYNVPPCISEDDLQRLCTEHGVPGFSKYKVFDAKPSSKTISGLLEFDSKTHAVEVLTVLNHYQIRIPNGSNPYTLKLCFSTSSHL
ncbi:heterogeneous nuclear ribonucleoprotein L-like [Sinocyclocheilus rhinocerous]|uniref:heterogeneous nuclear ribonucleoprotein L-like n=1 Tax=Sinocyclocheilus rhinocerous TaxID=307959 RepID=UPI0007B8F427|nr:PREDICTED: heterogeneous nuclear ribonucleoprotein L-like [Sinocyclocheilus rhinocerous]